MGILLGLVANPMETFMGLLGIITVVLGIGFKLRGNKVRRQKRTIRVHEVKAKSREQIAEADSWKTAKMKEVSNAEKAELLDMLNNDFK
jgi:cadmium resistance protein CadD (predicted permease)